MAKQANQFNKMKLPTWKEAKENIDLDSGTPLDKFIFENEPLENSDSREWREGLINALKYMGAALRDNPQAYTISSEVPDHQLRLAIDPDAE